MSEERRGVQLETVIAPRQRLRGNWEETKQYRELFYYFAWRDIKVRYKQTVIGAGWAVFPPIVTMVVFTFVFNQVAGVDSGSLPYAIFSYSGLLFWNYFANALTRSSGSLVDNQSVISKVYFPRIIPPVSATIVALADFLIATLVFIGLMAYYGIAPGLAGVLFFVPAVLLTGVAATGLGILFATLNVKYRDVRQALPFLVSTAVFLTPVIYPVTAVPDRYQWLLYLNPMTGVITGVRALTLHSGTLDPKLLAISVASALVSLALGLAYFRAKEREFADII